SPPSSYSAQLDLELHLQHTQLSLTLSSTFNMLCSTERCAHPSACLTQLDYVHHLQHE
ncbi:hypothetical protein L195_g062174, partial [Trifolium pratense]